MTREIKFRFVDDTGTIYGPMNLTDFLEKTEYCVMHLDAPFVEAENKDYMTYNEFHRKLAADKIIIEHYIGKGRWRQRM